MLNLLTGEGGSVRRLMLMPLLFGVLEKEDSGDRNLISEAMSLSTLKIAQRKKKSIHSLNILVFFYLESY